MATTSPKDGLYWCPKTSFTDFTLRSWNSMSRARLQIRGSSSASRIPGTITGWRTEKGDEIDIWEPRTGSIIFHAPGARATTIRPADAVPLLLGAWNELEIAASGQKLIIKLNGEVVNEYTGDGALNGYVGLQTNARDGAGVHFRNVQIKAGAAPAASRPKPRRHSLAKYLLLDDVTLPCTIYQATGGVEISKDRKVNVSPGCLVEGGNFRCAGGVIWAVRDSLFRTSQFEETLGAKFHAAGSLCDNVEMNKTGGWFVDRWSTRWTFPDVFSPWKFTRSELGMTDYSVRADRCTFQNLTLPRLKYKKDPADEAQSNDLKFANCHFIQCEVPESFLASTVDCVFEDCGFSSKPEDWKKTSSRPITVTAYTSPDTQRRRKATRMET